MNRTALRIGLAVATVVTTAAATLASTSGNQAAADPDRPYCSLTGMTTYAWDGGGDGTSWSDPANWVDDDAPGLQDRDSAYVCLPDGARVRLAAGDVALVQAVDTAPGSQLKIDAGAGLFVYGEGERTSVVRGWIEITGALGGPGTIELTGLSGTGVFSNDEVLPVPSTLASDPCALFEDLPPTACTDEDGRFVNHSAMNGYGGMQMLGGYDVVIAGALVPGDAGIGLSPGSRLVIRTGQQINIHGDADFYPVAGDGRRPVVVNNGIIRKFRGGGSPDDRGVTVISTRYRGPGEVWVEGRDQVVITDGSTRPGKVTAGSVLGSGPCRRVVGNCRFTTLRQAGRRQSAAFEAPSSQPVSKRARVTVRPRPDLRRPEHLGSPYLVHAGDLEATAATPAIIELRYDGSLLRGDTWRDVQVFRQRAAGEPWRRLRACRADGTPRHGARACVDRREIAGTSSRQVPEGGDDAILVVRTTVTSRWVGHRTR